MDLNRDDQTNKWKKKQLLEIYRSVNSVTFTYVLENHDDRHSLHDTLSMPSWSWKRIGYLCMVMSLAIHENIAYNSMLAIIKSIARMFETSIETFY